MTFGTCILCMDLILYKQHELLKISYKNDKEKMRMLIGKQVDRLVLKVMRLAEVYRPFLISEQVLPEVMLTEKGVSRTVKTGDSWGGEFCVSRFSFVAKGIEPGKKYRLFADTGAVEHQIGVNGNSVGILDHVEHASEPMFRIHRYIWLEGLKNGDEVTLDAYYSHTFPNTMPYDRPLPLAWTAIIPTVPISK